MCVCLHGLGERTRPFKPSFDGFLIVEHDVHFFHFVHRTFKLITPTLPTRHIGVDINYRTLPLTDRYAFGENQLFSLKSDDEGCSVIAPSCMYHIRIKTGANFSNLNREQNHG